MQNNSFSKSLYSDMIREVRKLFLHVCKGSYQGVEFSIMIVMIVKIV